MKNFLVNFGIAIALLVAACLNGFFSTREAPTSVLLALADRTITGMDANSSSARSALSSSQPLMTGIIRSSRMSPGFGMRCSTSSAARPLAAPKTWCPSPKASLPAPTR